MLLILWIVTGFLRVILLKESLYREEEHFLTSITTYRPEFSRGCASLPAILILRRIHWRNFSLPHGRGSNYFYGAIFVWRINTTFD